jgi:uncharacterized membrane protein SirB2
VSAHRATRRRHRSLGLRHRPRRHDWQLSTHHGWLTAKVVGLIGYIVLGSIALKRGRTRHTRVAAFAAALVMFAYIVSVAITKSPAGFWLWL